MFMERRRAVFSQKEKDNLERLFSKYRHILQNKRTDSKSVFHKKKIWRILAAEFNSLQNNSSRTPEQLKKCLENLKNKRKKEMLMDKMERISNDSGSFQSPTDACESIPGIYQSVDIETKDAIYVVPVMEEKYEAEFPEANGIKQEVVTEEFTDLPEYSQTMSNQTVVVEERTPVVKNRKLKTIRDIRCQRRTMVQKREQELHNARLKEQHLRTRDAELRLKQTEEEGSLRLSILKEQLLQEQLKTKKIQTELI
ncbi:hypothetical protein FQR65_LT05679 [Abscondita terminalis]|nr:hypothetical protein FQR65_LT05679 [Abscondita terminalis]